MKFRHRTDVSIIQTKPHQPSHLYYPPVKHSLKLIMNHIFLVFEDLVRAAACDLSDQVEAKTHQRIPPETWHPVVRWATLSEALQSQILALWNHCYKTNSNLLSSQFYEIEVVQSCSYQLLHIKSIMVVYRDIVFDLPFDLPILWAGFMSRLELGMGSNIGTLTTGTKCCSQVPLLYI